MAGITDLPCEVLISILRNLDNVGSLLPFFLTCRHFYFSFKENPTLVADVLQRQVTPGLVPYAITVLESARLDPHSPATVSELLEKLYTDRANLVGRLQTLPTRLLVQMGRMHDVINSLTAEFASSAWARLSGHASLDLPRDISISPTEHFRFCRAFYRFELYSNLFGSKARVHSVDSYKVEKKRFFFRHEVWENEQLSCIYDFLELRFAKVSHDFFAHDVFSGSVGIDYLTAGDNIWRQIGISQGLEYIQRLCSVSSYDERAALLDFGSSGDTTGALYHPLYYSLVTSCDPIFADDVAPGLHEGEYEHLLEAAGSEDPEYEDYYNAFDARSEALGFYPMLEYNSWSRERAYVLWDVDRLKPDVLDVIKHSMADSELQLAENDMDIMHQSFRERAEISDQGGQGYWRKGDTSRIVWSLPPVEG